MKKIVLTTLLVSVMAIPASGIELTREYRKEGAWTMYAGLTTDQVPICILSTDTKDTTKTLQLRAYKGTPTLIVQISDQLWPTPTQNAIDIQLTTDDNTPWNAIAGYTTTNPTTASFAIGTKDTGPFAVEVGNSSIITISFPNTDITPWKFSPKGMGALLGDFAECITLINS